MKLTWREKLYCYGCVAVLLLIIGGCGMLCVGPRKPQLEPHWASVKITVDGQTVIVPMFSTITNLTIEMK